MRSRDTAEFTAAALLVSLTAILAQIQIPLPLIPISLTTLGVCLCGALLPPRSAFFAMLAYALLGAVGVPVFSGFLAGPSVLFGPTGGFILSFPLCAAAIGALTQRFGLSRRALPAAMSAGTLLCYIVGTAWFMSVSGTGLSESLTVCVLPFIPGDAVKVALAAWLVRRLIRAMHIVQR